jgi:hypothetical protein
VNSPGPVRPNFLYVGAGKSASTWMFEIFREHPDVFVAEAKDLMFFDRYYDRGINWYLSHFAHSIGQPAIGELSHDYFLDETFAERIRRHLPDARILVCLREPVERTFSEYLYDRTLYQFVPAQRYRSGFSFQDFASLPRIRKRSQYFVNLSYFFRRFPRERILVQFYDDLQRDPRAFARQLFRFLGIDAEYQPPSLHRRVNTARDVRSTLLASLAYRAGQVLRRYGRPAIVGEIKRQRWIERMLYRPYRTEQEKPAIPAAVREELYSVYHQDDQKLADLIGRPLPAGWMQPEAEQVGSRDRPVPAEVPPVAVPAPSYAVCRAGY